MGTGIRLIVDYAFKRVFGVERNKDLLMSLLNAIVSLEGGKVISDIRLLNPFNERDVELDKLSILDIKAQDNYGNLYDIEVQIIFERYFVSRLVYYASKLYSEGLVKGSEYSDLKPVISVSLVDSPIFKDSKDFINRFLLRNESCNVVLTRDITFYVIELPKFNIGEEELSTEMERWLYLIKNSSDLDESVVRKLLGGEDYIKALKELEVMKKVGLERERYLSRLKYEKDLSGIRREGLDIGIEIGRKEGVELGRKEGVEKGKEMLIRTMLKEGLDIELISRVSGYSEEE